ncbi:MAG: hypothetical protein ABIR06_17445 [Cyclobacteriaceae bacterium]
MPNKKRYLLLKSIIPYLQNEKDGDELFIQYKDKKIAPAKSKFYKVTGDSIEINIEIPLGKTEKWVALELWEFDRLSPNDLLGHFKLLIDQSSDNFTAELIRQKESAAKYVLNWELIERLNKKVKSV